MSHPPAQRARDRSAAEWIDASESASSESSESLLALMSAARAGDRRDAQRHSFHAVQRVAPWRGIAKPTETDFQLVWCHDLSTSSISFYWSTAPDFEQVIVALASPKGTIRLLARVLFFNPQAVEMGQYLICCQFVRRLPN